MEKFHSGAPVKFKYSEKVEKKIVAFSQYINLIISIYIIGDKHRQLDGEAWKRRRNFKWPNLQKKTCQLFLLEARLINACKDLFAPWERQARTSLDRDGTLQLILFYEWAWKIPL